LLNVSAYLCLRLIQLAFVFHAMLVDWPDAAGAPRRRRRQCGVTDAGISR
jgi:hypothetical protein